MIYNLEFTLKLLVIINFVPVLTNIAKEYGNPKIVIGDSDDLIVVGSNSVIGIHHQAHPIAVAANLTYNLINACHSSLTRTNLVISIHPNEYFNVLKEIGEVVSRINVKMAKSNCQIFIYLESCLSSVKHNTGLNPFNWYSNLYLIQYCKNGDNNGMNEKLIFWELYSVKNRNFIKSIVQKQRNASKSLTMGKSETRHDGTVLINLTEFFLHNETKISRRLDLEGLDVVASVFLIEGDEVSKTNI